MSALTSSMKTCFSLSTEENYIPGDWLHKVIIGFELVISGPPIEQMQQVLNKSQISPNISVNEVDPVGFGFERKC